MTSAASLRGRCMRWVACGRLQHRHVPRSSDCMRSHPAAPRWHAAAFSTATSLKQLAAPDALVKALKGSLSYELQRALDQHAPESIQVPSGATVRLKYVRDGIDPLASDDANGAMVPTGAGGEGRSPVAASKLQDWFGAAETPHVGPPGKPLPVLLHALSPARPPLACLLMRSTSLTNNRCCCTCSRLRVVPSQSPPTCRPSGPARMPTLAPSCATSTRSTHGPRTRQMRRRRGAPTASWRERTQARRARKLPVVISAGQGSLEPRSDRRVRSARRARSIAVVIV